MKRVLVKLCGITEERDALEAVHLGVDVVGFHFLDGSPRFLEPDLARRIVERLPVFLGKVGVFADVPMIRVVEIARKVGLTAVQLQGNEAPSLCSALHPLPWYKAVRVGADFDADALSEYPCTTFLLDRSGPGTPERPASAFDWRRARALGVHGRILIGGDLDPTNVALAVEDARPYGVDVLEGVEFAPGKKDLDRVERFVEAVRRAERRIESEQAGSIPADRTR